jgi:FlaA1/EpsC-like NDP-sugar epimerase
MILISTDKAVRSTSVMGCSKRFAEMLVQAHAKDQKPGENNLILSMVRFGNVLNSSGSIVPLFRKQINEGGPITITHPDVTRYFMTIPEAVSLVLYSAFISKGGEVFVLNMGKPIKIIDLARKMISLSGLSEKSEINPNGDIEIKYIGLRDGEKINEELFFEDDSLKVSNDIMIAKEDFTDLSYLDNILTKLDKYIALNDEQEIITILRSHISKDLSR